MEEAQELAELNRINLSAISDIIGGPAETADGKLEIVETEVSQQLREQGRRWADHVLEGPISWIMSAIYICVTVIYGATPLSALLDAVHTWVDPAEATIPELDVFNYTNVSDALFDALQGGGVTGPTAEAVMLEAARALARAGRGDEVLGEAESDVWSTIGYIVAAVDSMVYLFLPWWTTVLIRLLQGRPWLHRVAGRAVLIGDVPWVAQSIEAYASKLFALAYKNAQISVASGNPADHLVHRHTHRVVRGCLLAVGRPDGRLNALTSAENTVCLSLNQASSIQNYGVTCEV